jgi:prevent-host-death family protein
MGTGTDFGQCQVSLSPPVPAVRCRVAGFPLCTRREGAFSRRTGQLRCTLVLLRGDHERYATIRLVCSTSQNIVMREIQASDAKARLPQLLDDVERGETLIITRHGRVIARIVPEVNRRQEEVDKALASIRELRNRAAKITLEEILSAREEGRKY